MCTIQESITLNETDSSCLTWCRCCKTFSLTFNNCCATFSNEEIWQFKKVLDGLGKYDYRFHMMGKWHTIVKNPHSCVGFCLTTDDVVRIKDLLDQSLTLYEAFEVVYDNKHE